MWLLVQRLGGKYEVVEIYEDEESATYNARALNKFFVKPVYSVWKRIPL